MNSSTMDDQADVIILGLGTGGEELGGRLAMAGLDVVGIEPALVGGECAYWACIPSKMMIRAANLLQEARRVNGVAGRADVVPDWTPVAARIREHATGDWDDTLAVQRFTGRGGRFIRGRGTLTGPRTVAVGDQSFTARRAIVIATGSRPSVPPIPGLAEVGYWTSHEAISAVTLPESLLVLGGGAVGCELGQAFSRFGVNVTIIDSGDRLLSSEEPEAGQVLGSVFEAEGISVHTGKRVERVKARGDSVAAILSDGTEVTADRLLVAVGRTVDLDGLGLTAAGLGTRDGFIQVDEHLRVADGIWAMGDVTGKGLFSHVALYQAQIVEAGILGRHRPPADYSSLPRVTFTDPEIGAVGMSEADARTAGFDVAVAVKGVPATFRGWIHGTGNEGMMKLVVDRGTGRLVGATVAAPHGGEVLGLLTVAVHAGVTIKQLQHMIYAFPTFHGGVGEATGAYARALVQVLDPEAEFLLQD
jgi:pyruvate/2-oxoglutarate dehydrogenase complex dihydrolipoamide dehydrogenase (E3) component